MYTTRYQMAQKRFVLTSKKCIKDVPLTGKFYGLIWDNGETVESLSYRDAMRVARIRGCNLLEWEKSQAYKKFMEGTPAAPTTTEEVVEATESVFDTLKKAAGINTKPRRKRKTASTKTTKK